MRKRWKRKYVKMKDFYHKFNFFYKIEKKFRVNDE